MIPNMTAKSNRYRDAGVSIDAGNALVSHLRPKLAASAAALAARGAVRLPDAGGFAAAWRMPALQKPVLTACTDGIGTKAALLAEADLPETAGIDVVAMCVNDLLCVGAQPLAFLDYYACDSLSPEFVARVIDGILRGCDDAGCALVGGETAEMPGTYAGDMFDLAGFALGAAEETELFDTSIISSGDALIAIASSGPHANGYSLIRKILRDAPPPPKEVMDAILSPTRIYCKSIAALRAKISVRGLAHITGGGISENLPRILPPDTAATIHGFALPPVFAWLQKNGNIDDDEMRRVFNCGVGMVAVVSESDVDAAVSILQENGETCRRLGAITTGTPGVIYEQA